MSHTKRVTDQPFVAEILADSINESGQRLTTMKVRFHRFVLAEFNTHRVFSRNSASSRAIPLETQLKLLAAGPAFPISWPVEQPGMQGGSELTGADLLSAQRLVERVYQSTVDEINQYTADLKAFYGDDAKSHRLHKSVINRLLEPFMYHTVIVSSTEWENFFEQRCSPLAQPEIRVAAEVMRDIYRASTPTTVHVGHWHLPLVDSSDMPWIMNFALETKQSARLIACAISVARCARVSYLTHDGVRDPLKDVDLFNKLITADPPHWSPLEHVATPAGRRDQTTGNFTGWSQLRHSQGLWNPGQLGPIQLGN